MPAIPLFTIKTDPIDTVGFCQSGALCLELLPLKQAWEYLVIIAFERNWRQNKSGLEAERVIEATAEYQKSEGRSRTGFGTW